MQGKLVPFFPKASRATSRRRFGARAFVLHRGGGGGGGGPLAAPRAGAGCPVGAAPPGSARNGNAAAGGCVCVCAGGAAPRPSQGPGNASPRPPRPGCRPAPSRHQPLTHPRGSRGPLVFGAPPGRRRGADGQVARTRRRAELAPLGRQPRLGHPSPASPDGHGAGSESSVSRDSGGSSSSSSGSSW